MSSQPTNLLFVFSDQHRWCDLGCYGNPDVPTPNLDAFAAQGLRFNPDNIKLRPNVPEVIQHTKNSQKSRAEIREWLAGYYAQITALEHSAFR